MSRRWPVDGNNSERLPDGIVIEGYDADTRIYYYRSTIDDTRYRSKPGVKFGLLIPLVDKSRRVAGEAPVELVDSSGRKHTATPYRMPSAASGSSSRPRAVTFNDAFTPRSQPAWDNESRTVVEEENDDDDDDQSDTYSFVEEKGSFTVEKGGSEVRAAPLTTNSGLRRAHTTSEVRSSADQGGVGKKVGKLARALSKRIVGGGSGAPRWTPEEEQGGQAMRYDPAKAVGRRRAATTFDDILSAAPPVERKR
ncbi:hypothetical protein QBC42DRAFT_284818 [Cladorrhinum samala]|uniref:Uncharacterized protein n=1 Tax=Cladorrhinum samala TaxID=585594 RepID=A0AAV9HT49_9PEZI|nr:hypothetical protein QBC42DRAFT_284818 [Cladorrhinum samala]